MSGGQLLDKAAPGAPFPQRGNLSTGAALVELMSAAGITANFDGSGNLGVTIQGASGAVTINVAEADLASLGAKTDVAWDGAASSAGMIALLKALYGKDEAIRALLAGNLRDTTGAQYVTGLTQRIKASITRPATTPTYAAGQALGSVGGSVKLTFSNVVRANGGTGVILGAKLAKGGVTGGQAGTPSGRLWLYSQDPSPALTDTGAFTISSTMNDVRIGYIDFTSFVAGSDIAEGVGSLPSNVLGIANVAANSRDIFGVFAFSAAYTGVASEVFNFYLDTQPD